MTDSNKIKIILGAAIKELRIQKGITQEQLAEYLDLQPHTIAILETGKSFVSSEVLAKFCNFFDVDPCVFFIKNIVNKSQEDLDYIKEIKKILPVFSSSKLREIYNILLVMQK